MMEYYGLILAIAGLVIGYFLSKYGYSQYVKTVDLIIKALEDGKITKEEAKEILSSLIEALDKK